MLCEDHNPASLGALPWDRPFVRRGAYIWYGKMKTSISRLEPSPSSVADVEAEAERKESVAEAISTDLAPASAIAILAKAETPADALDAALKPLAAGVTRADDDSKVRLQLMFPDGSLLPIELDRATGEALAAGLTEALSEQPAAGGENNGDSAS